MIIEYLMNTAAVLLIIVLKGYFEVTVLLKLITRKNKKLARVMVRHIHLHIRCK